MSVLPDHEIESRCKIGRPLISPFNFGQLQPASYDVQLAPKLMRLHSSSHVGINLRRRKPRYVDFTLTESGLCLRPLEFVLGSTVEKVDIPPSLVGRIEGKSSTARVGIQIHTAGYLDPGFRGNVTLEIVNFSPLHVMIWPGMKIAQFSFDKLTSPCDRPYGSPGLGSHYQDADGVDGTHYGEDV